MNTHLRRHPRFLPGLLLILVITSPAFAEPLDYRIFDTDTLLNLGTFAVDPDLASPSGPSNVGLSAFSITDTVGSYGVLTVTLAELVGASAPFARFVDGQIQALSANSQFELPGIGVNVDIVPEDAPADLNFVGVFQMFAVTLPGLTNTQFGPVRGIGIKEATVPEPSTIFLMSLGAAAVALLRQRDRRSSARVEGKV